MASDVVGARGGIPRDPEASGLSDRTLDVAGAHVAGRQRFDWRRSYARSLTTSDLVVLVLVVFGTQIAWFGLNPETVAIRDDATLSAVSYWLFSVGLIAAWMWSLSLVDSRSDRIIGTGSTEYIRIVSASARLFGLIAIFAFLLRVDVARGYLLISFPLGVAALLVERWLWRKWLIARRAKGEYSARVLLVGSPQAAAQIGASLQRSPSAGYLVVGACVPGGRAGTALEGDIPIVGDIADATRLMTTLDADTIAVTNTDDLPPSGIRRISWGLEAGRQHLVVAPSIVDVAGPRIQTRPVAGVPLIHVETPQYSLGQRLVKRTMDIILGGILLIVLSPLMIGVAIAIRSAGEGPALFRQTRIGLDGRPFKMRKFRTMVVGAENRLSDLEGRRNAGNEVLFKMTDDPRVIPIGRFLRRYSLDELPQLFNVLGGSMSLVGPRPPLPHEVARYADDVHRRFLVKPGITGMWQVSGRSSLSWAESVRLDLSYVENWTLVGDVVILFKTLRAALFPGGTSA